MAQDLVQMINASGEIRLRQPVPLLEVVRQLGKVPHVERKGYKIHRGETNRYDIIVCTAYLNGKIKFQTLFLQLKESKVPHVENILYIYKNKERTGTLVDFSRDEQEQLTPKEMVNRILMNYSGGAQ